MAATARFEKHPKCQILHRCMSAVDDGHPHCPQTALRRRRIQAEWVCNIESEFRKHPKCPILHHCMSPMNHDHPRCRSDIFRSHLGHTGCRRNGYQAVFHCPSQSMIMLLHVYNLLQSSSSASHQTLCFAQYILPPNPNHHPRSNFSTRSSAKFQITHTWQAERMILSFEQ